MRTEPPWDELDPGVLDVVRMFWGAGFAPTDSGDGVSKPTGGRWMNLPFPHVFMVVETDRLIGETDRAISLLASAGYELDPLKGWSVEGVYDGRLSTIFARGPDA